MTCAHCVGSERFFDRGRARKDLKRYRKKGPTAPTRLLLDLVAESGVRGRSVLDIGGGVGAVQHELLARGAAQVVNVDASPAYQEANRDEARVRGHEGRVEYLLGDFVELAPRLAAADVVTLDRVLCCYPDMPALVDASADRALRTWGFVSPREVWWVRAALAAANLAVRLTGNPFRVYVHPLDAVDRRLRGRGFGPPRMGRRGMWEVRVYERAAPAGNLTLA